MAEANPIARPLRPQAATDITASTSPVTKTARTFGPAVAAFRFAQGRQGQCAARSLERPSGRLGVQRKGLPVEIIAEFENWRRIRDSDGEEGWVYQSMLSGKRTAVVAPWRKAGGGARCMPSPKVRCALIAKLKAGRRGARSRIAPAIGATSQRGGYDGWIEQPMLWGVYPGEQVEIVGSRVP